MSEIELSKSAEKLITIINTGCNESNPKLPKGYEVGASTGKTVPRSVGVPVNGNPKLEGLISELCEMEKLFYVRADVESGLIYLTSHKIRGFKPGTLPWTVPDEDLPNGEEIDTEAKSVKSGKRTRKERAPRVADKDCLCGCGELTASTFKMGHDMKLKGAIRRCIEKKGTTEDKQIVKNAMKNEFVLKSKTFQSLYSELAAA